MVIAAQSDRRYPRGGSFGELIGQTVTDANLFHLAPLICLEFRGRKLVGQTSR